MSRDSLQTRHVSRDSIASIDADVAVLLFSSIACDIAILLVHIFPILNSSTSREIFTNNTFLAVT